MILTAQGASATPKSLRPVEEALLSSVGGRGALWTGRGAAAFYWGLRAAAATPETSGPPEVVLPSIGCTVLADAARLAGWRPRFADTDPNSGMLTPDTVRLRINSRTRAVVFIHLFGRTGDLAALGEWCRHHHLLLIEDAAQALGACLPDGRPVGAVGDMVVYSFNRTKILGCGGGLLLLKSGQLGRALEPLILRQPAPRVLPDADLLRQSERNLHHALVALLRLGETEGVSELYLRLRKAYAQLCLLPMARPQEVFDAWGTLAQHLAGRRQKAEIYAGKLAGGPWRLLNGWRDSGVCWRYSLLVDRPDRAALFSEAVRGDGFHVSNLYWPANQLWRPEDLCPEADAFARRVVNLWVDPGLDDAWVRRCAESLLRNAEKILL